MNISNDFINKWDLQLLPESFYENPNPLFLGPQLLGKYLFTSVNGNQCLAKIIELEIYKAPEDKGSHAYGDKKTARTQVMFESGGIAYIYLCYGIHQMFNIVTGPKNLAHAILIRAIEPLEGINHMISRRNIKPNGIQLTNGPGKLCQAMGISKQMNSTKLFSLSSHIQIYTDGSSIETLDIIKSPRVGIAYAEECALWPWRYYLKNNKHVSRPLIQKY